MWRIISLPLVVQFRVTVHTIIRRILEVCISPGFAAGLLGRLAAGKMYEEEDWAAAAAGPPPPLHRIRPPPAAPAAPPRVVASCSRADRPLPAADARQGGQGPRLTWPDGAVP